MYILFDEIIYFMESNIYMCNVMYVIFFFKKKKKRIKIFYVYLVFVVNDEFNLKYYIEIEFLYIEYVKI